MSTPRFTVDTSKTASIKRNSDSSGKFNRRVKRRTERITKGYIKSKNVITNHPDFLTIYLLIGYLIILAFIIMANLFLQCNGLAHSTFYAVLRVQIPSGIQWQVGRVWLNAPVLKTGEDNTSKGSNPLSTSKDHL